MSGSNKNVFFVIFFGLVCVAVTPIYGQSNSQSPSNSSIVDLRFDNFSLDKGLSHSRVESIVQDDHGFIWLGTYDGLNRWDGNEFTVYKNDRDNPNSLSNNTIIAMSKDQAGMIWIGTSGGGVDKFDPDTETFTHYRHDPEIANSLSGNVINENSIYSGKQGHIWIATKSNGLNRFNPTTGSFTHYRHDAGNTNSISSDKTRGVYQHPATGQIFVGTRDAGLNSINLDTGKITRYQHEPGNPNSISGNDVSAVIGGDRNTLWITTRKNGLNSFDLESGHFTRYLFHFEGTEDISVNDFSVIFQDSKGILWIGTHGGGMIRFDPASNSSLNYQTDLANPNGSLGTNWVRSIYEDKAGLLVVGTSGGGISKIDSRPPKFVHFKPEPGNPNSIKDGFMLSVFEDSKGILWVGNDRVVNRIDRKTGEFKFYKYDEAEPNGISNGSLMATVEDKQGILWFATHNGGLNRFDPETEIFKAFRPDPENPEGIKNTFLALHQDADGIFWIGTKGNGLNRFDPQSENFTYYRHDPGDPETISDNEVYAVYEDHEGFLWLGTRNGGLNRFDPETEKVKRYEHDHANPQSVGGSIVSSIYEDENRVLWVGTSGGLSKLNRESDRFSHYTEKHGLPSNHIQGILPDDAGNLWLSSNNGLSRFDPRTENFRNYDVLDGLQSNQFNRFAVHYKSKSGEMFFGGINGFNAFYPDRVKDSSFLPPVILTDFLLFHRKVKVSGGSVLDKPIYLTEAITLPHDQNVFSLSFASLDYTAPAKNRYRYKLEGFDDQWTETDSKNRLATYTNMDPGAFQFRVQGSNSDGVWNEQAATLDIVITPPFWQTWWFRTLLFFVAAMLVFGVFIVQHRAAIYREQLLNEKVADRTRELEASNSELERLNEEQKSFSYSVSHDLRAPLRAINGFSDLLVEDCYDSLNDTGKDYLSRIRNASVRMGDLIESLLKLSHLSRQEMVCETVHLDQMANRIVSQFADIKARENVEISIQPGMEVSGDSRLIDAVLSNLLNNAWKFTAKNDQTKIEFSVNSDGEQEVFCVRDNGAGFDMEQADNLFKEFKRLHSEKEFEGTGIGLATVKRIVKRHGGKVWAEAKVGEGAAFYFTLAA